MKRKTELEMERERTAKITRTLIRLKYSLLADEEINNKLPTLIAQVDLSAANGELLRLREPDLDQVLEDL